LRQRCDAAAALSRRCPGAACRPSATTATGGVISLGAVLVVLGLLFA
jgi:hypothetical protein